MQSINQGKLLDLKLNGAMQVLMFEGKESAVWYEPLKDRMWVECKSSFTGSWFITEDFEDDLHRTPFLALYLLRPEIEGLVKLCDI